MSPLVIEAVFERTAARPPDRPALRWGVRARLQREPASPPGRPAGAGRPDRRPAAGASADGPPPVLGYSRRARLLPLPSPAGSGLDLRA